jgi:2-polyprenyl-3-methyl-5-hydroxy-6-metoxy-1,4-benzoquinol methylase
MSKNILDNINNLSKQCENYQDILINNKVYIKGKRDCENRYKCIKKFFNNQRKFTVLDIGANFGYYSLKIANDFPKSYVVMIQQPGIESKLLNEILKANTSINKRTCLLELKMNSDNMRKLQECEHFDYIICNNILHHVSDYKEVYNSLKKMCKYLIIETPPINDNKSCGLNYLTDIYNFVNNDCDYKSTEKFQRHTNTSTFSHIYMMKFKNIITKSRAYFNAPHIREDNYVHSIEDNKRTFHKKNEENSKKDYIYGINLRTCIELNGLYPSRKQIVDKLKNIQSDYKWDNSLRDIRVHNFILNDKLYLIDTINKKDGDEFIKSDNEQLEKVRLYLLGKRGNDV